MYLDEKGELSKPEQWPSGFKAKTEVLMVNGMY